MPNTNCKIDRDFAKFHADNPIVWELFVKFTLQLIDAKFKHYSADAVLHRIRWTVDVEIKGGEFKINNNHSSRYARLFHKTFPQYAGFFRMRGLKSQWADDSGLDDNNEGVTQ